MDYNLTSRHLGMGSEEALWLEQLEIYIYKLMYFQH